MATEIMDNGHIIPTVDKRVARTHAAIDRAFEHLLATTPYSKITVSAVAREADINRKTFYAHYPSIDDLLEHHIRKAILLSTEQVSETLTHTNHGTALQELTKLVVYQLAQNPHFNSHIAECVPSTILLGMLLEPLRELILEIRARRNAPGPEPENLDLLIASYLGSIVACMREWERTPEPRPSLDQVCQLISDLYEDKAEALI